MAESKRPICRTKGAILMMVLTIMFVLIIMLVATLSVVSTAKKRTYNSFEETQANLTSKSALEFFIKDLCTNTTDTNNNDDPYFTLVSPKPKMTYAREIEVDIRLLKSKDNNTTIGKTATQLTNMGLNPTKYSYDDNDELGLCADDTTKKITGSFAAYTKDKLEYKITLPKAENSTYEYGKFADSDKEVIVTVEVLDRCFNKGPDGKIESGNRKLDKMKLRITATAYFNNYEANSVLIVDTDTPPVTNNNDFTKGIVATGSITASTKIRPYGGMASNDGVGGTYTMENNGVADSIYCSGNLKIKSSGNIDLGPDAYIAVVGNIDYDNAIAITSKNNKSFIYCGGKFTKQKSGNIGADGTPLDLICNGAEITDGIIYGNIYCDGDLTLGGVTVNGDIFVHGDFHTGTSTIKGNVYVYDNNPAKGNLFLEGNKVDGSGNYSAGTVGGSDSERINGIIYCDTTKTFTSGGVAINAGATGGVYTQNLNLKYFYSGAFPTVGNSSVYSDTSLNSSRKVFDATSRMIEYTLPTRTTPKKYNIPSYESEYPTYMKVIENKTGTTTTGYKYDSKLDAFQKYKADVGATKTSFADMAASASAISVQGNKITGSGVLSGVTRNTGDPPVEITAGSTIILKHDQTYQGVFVVSDDTSPTIIIVPDNAEVTIKARILSKELSEILGGAKNNTVYSGVLNSTNEPFRCAAPNIYMYVGSGAKVTVDDSGINVGVMINAYIYGPEADFTLSKAGKVNVVYNDIVYSSPAIGVVGAAIFNDVTSTDEAGIVFIKPTGGATPPAPDGKPFVTWKVYQYTNDLGLGDP